MKWIILHSLLIIGVVWCQKDILDQLPNLPDLNVNDIETEVIANYMKEALDVLKQKCSNVSGGDEVYTELERKANDLKTFIMDNINITQVMSELEEAKLTGSMDEVFAKYCAKKPETTNRLKDITETFKKCLLPEEQKSVDMKFNLTEKMVHFVCEKDGDKIAMFIANGGEECLGSKTDGLQDCFNKSSVALPSNNWQTLSLVQVDEQVCEEFPVLEKCVVAVLEECKVKTPANIVGALFRYLRNNMACAPIKESVTAADGRKVGDYTNRVKRSQINESVVMRLQTKCQKNAPNPDAYVRLNASFINFITSLGSNLFEKKGDCLFLKRETELQMDMFLLNLKACLSPKEDFVPKFFRSSVETIFDYLCEDNGRKMREFQSASGLQCLINSDVRRFNTCAKPSATHSTDGGEVILQESAFCNDVDTMRKCVQRELVYPCSQDARFRKISEDLLEKINARCSGCSIFVNAFLLFGLILFQLRRHL